MDPAEYGRRAKERKAMGLTWMKMDLGINVLDGIPDTVMRPSGLSNWEQHVQPNLFIATEVTDKGIDRLCEYVAAVRENIGYEMPLSMDHLGHIGVKSVIRLGKAYEKFNLEWMEDVIPWYYTDLLKEITQESPTPTLTGEDIYKIDDFETLCRESRRRQDSSRPRDLRRNSADAQHRRHGLSIWRAHGHAFCGNAGRAAWQTCTAPQPRATSSRWKITRSTYPSGRTWSQESRSPSSTRDLSRCRRRPALALR